MKFTLSWLKEYLSTPAPASEIAEALTRIGIEVESFTTPDPALEDFIVAHVIAMERHPQADRLNVCQVDTGSGLLQVVCGAPNAHVGMKGILARPGVTIPASGERLHKGVIRGVESAGMLCSARELNLGTDEAGVIALPAETQAGAKALDVIVFDPVFDVAVTPNRADCLGVQGIARDLAAAGLGVFTPGPVPAVASAFQSPLGVLRAPEAEALCPLFVGRFIRGVRNGPSPEGVQRRLAAVGLRPISALVDITNLLSLEAARPLHVFDAERLQGGSVTVRLAREGESLAALNDKTYPLSADMLVIADAAGPQALAGLIGGTQSACCDSTTTVFLESALFDPGCVARAGRALGIESDARHRFERGVDPASAVVGAEWATRLILAWCGGEASDLVIAGAEPTWRRTITLRADRVYRLTGRAFPVPVLRHRLCSLGCTVSGEDEALTVAPPSWRRDLEGEHDLIEEIVRLEGYDQVPAESLAPPPTTPPPTVPPTWRRRSQVRRTLAARGMMETITWSFMASQHAALFAAGSAGCGLMNPISADLDALRPSLVPNLVRAVRRNAAHDMPDVALFEIGPQFDGMAQKLVVAGVRAGHDGPRHWSRPVRAVDVFDAKADAWAVLMAAGVPLARLKVDAAAPHWYHPGRSGVIRFEAMDLGWFGEIHPRLAHALDVKGPLVGFEIFLEALPPSDRTKSSLKIPPFHPVVRDFAFVVENSVSAEQMRKAAHGVETALITAVEVFDIYEGLGDGCKSLAVSMTLQPTAKTMTDQEIEDLSARIIDAVIQTTGATLRT